MVTLYNDSLFTTDCKVLVNTVNCAGAMGKGIALEFKNRYPDMYFKYKEICKNGLLEPGKLWIYPVPNSDLRILNFPTKKHWSSKSKLDYIEAGLEKFVNTYKEKGITEIAFPLLGCTNGGLNYQEVLPIMVNTLNSLDIDVKIYCNGIDENFFKVYKDHLDYCNSMPQ